MALYPLTFLPIPKERPWGGHHLTKIFGKAAPNSAYIGETWEISDRPGDESIIAEGPLKGRSLRWLMQRHGSELLGREVGPDERFPWLIKLLDAREDLSLQVHPPTVQAAQLGGESKDELWYFAACQPNSRIYVGLQEGVAREDFIRRTADGSVAQCLHSHATRPGDVMAIPSGRVHALGAGNVVFEIQENSDTTYRVFDWNRVGPDGRSRELHLGPALASIDFSDSEPGLICAEPVAQVAGWMRRLIRYRRFIVDEVRVAQSTKIPDERAPGQMAVLGVVSGGIEVGSTGERLRLEPGQFVLLPAALGPSELRTLRPTTLLRVIGGNPA